MKKCIMIYAYNAQKQRRMPECYVVNQSIDEIQNTIHAKYATPDLRRQQYEKVKIQPKYCLIGENYLLYEDIATIVEGYYG